MPQKICEFSERESIVNVIHLLVSVIFGLHLHWHAFSGESQLRVINVSLRSSRQPRKSSTAVASLAARGKMWFPTSRYLAKWHSDVQAADGRVSWGWMNCRNEVYRGFSRLQFWISTSKVRSNILAIGLIWKQETFTEVLKKCAYRLPNIYKAFYWLGQMCFRKRILMIAWEMRYKQVSLQDFLLLD